VTSDQIRAAFLAFFREKGHQVIPSSSLIPKGDPTLLLTSAGMVPFKPYFLGEELPPSPRLVSCQKCFRATDIDAVGDPCHLTFFEMLGNFSVGDYFKAEAISWAWQFVTRRLGLPAERLWITIFVDDDDAFSCWRKLGVAEGRILRFGEKENFWGPAGDSGPCGPCSEILYDLGEGVGCGRPSCAPGCDCGRFSEVWNLVFTQYNQDRESKRILLPKPNIDTGMGLERTAAIMQGKTSVYETDLFTPLLECIAALTGRKYGADNDNDNNMRIIAEHSRGVAFLIADGVIPDNEGAGYVLRRLLRRAALLGRRLGLDKPFLVKTAETTIQQMGHIYPELVKRRDFILKVTRVEEEKFEQTLTTGLELLDGIMEKAASKGKNKISGVEAFNLYDTYGFPVELTVEITAGRGFSVDLDGFEKEMEKQRERARQAHKFELGEEVGLPAGLNLKATTFVGYQNLKNKSAIISILVGNKPVARVGEGQKAGLILEATPFYGEMGGQAGDSGQIKSSSGKFVVTDTVRLPADVILHRGYVAEGHFSAGDMVEAIVDEERRLDIARNHTATHLLQFALRQVLGEHVQQRGSLVAPERLRFDLSHLVAMTEAEIKRVQHIVNEQVRDNLVVYDEELPYKKAIAEGAIALFDEKYGDTVRVLRIGKPSISAELCGGTHVSSTGEIGAFYIIGESSIGAGLRRIEAVSGRGAEEFIDKRLADLSQTARYLEAELDGVPGKVHGLVAELGKERKRALSLERELSLRIAESLLSQAEVVSGVTVLSARTPSLPVAALREMGDRLREKLRSAVVVLGTVYENKPLFLAAVTPDLVARGYHAGEIIKQVAGVTGGSGGGKASFAQAGGRDKDKLDKALKLVKSVIQKSVAGGNR